MATQGKEELLENLRTMVRDMLRYSGCLIYWMLPNKPRAMGYTEPKTGSGI